MILRLAWFACALLAPVFLTAPAGAQAADVTKPVSASQAPAQPTPDQPVIARVTLKTPAELQRFLRLGLDVLETRDGDDLFILTTSAEVDQLRIDGWTIRIDADHTSTLQRQWPAQPQAPTAPRPRTFMSGYRT